MDARIDTSERIRQLLAAALDGTLTHPQAEELAEADRDLLKLAWMAVARRIAEQNQRIDQLQARLGGPPKLDPATPSGQRPVYTKPSAPKRKGKPGARKGHPGTRRPTPQRIDEHKEHRLERCPCCGGELQRCRRKRTRAIEDILEDLRTVVAEHTVHRDYCPACKKHVEPVVPDAMPKAAIGHRTVALTAWLHYGVGVSLSQVRELLGIQFQTRLATAIRRVLTGGGNSTLARPVRLVVNGGLVSLAAWGLWAFLESQGHPTAPFVASLIGGGLGVFGGFTAEQVLHDVEIPEFRPRIEWHSESTHGIDSPWRRAS